MTRTLALRASAPRLLAVVGLTLLLAMSWIVFSPLGSGGDTVTAASRTSRTALHDAMRELWEDHIVWTRMVIVSFVSDLPDLDVAVDRLLDNQDEIGDAVRPFYGDVAADELTRLLREHITGAAALLVAAKSGDTAAIELASTAWYANGDEIGALLADANPRNWDRGEMQAMMRDHLDLTLAEAVARLEGRWADDVTAYDQIHAQILHMADMLTDGIVAQFPNGFSR